VAGKKLTKQEIETIISLLKQGKKVQEIANMFGVSRYTIWRIKKKYVPEEELEYKPKKEKKEKKKEESPIPPEMIPEPEEQPSEVPKKLVRGGKDAFTTILLSLSAQESNLARARITYLFDVGKHVVDNYERLAQDMGITVKELVDRAIEFYLDWRDYIEDLEDKYYKLRDLVKMLLIFLKPKLEHFARLNLALRTITSMHALNPVDPAVIKEIIRLIFLGENYGIREDFDRYLKEIGGLGEEEGNNSKSIDKYNPERLKGGRC